MFLKLDRKTGMLLSYHSEISNFCKLYKKKKNLFDCYTRQLIVKQKSKINTEAMPTLLTMTGATIIPKNKGVLPPPLSLLLDL